MFEEVYVGEVMVKMKAKLQWSSELEFACIYKGKQRQVSKQCLLPQLPEITRISLMQNLM